METKKPSPKFNNDVPITCPKEDLFGFDSFARAISDCIKENNEPYGSVVAIWGVWGSGKSSAINLVRRHLRKSGEDIDIIDFPAWVYRNKNTLTAGFFKELYAGLSPVLSKQKQAATALRNLGANLVDVGNLAGMAAGWFDMSFLEKATSAFLAACGRFIKPAPTIEDLQNQLSDALRKEKKRFLVVIDDLDRLAPEEALVIFRLIKSIGRLPNVMYLLAYDRDATEKAVKKKFKSEGAHYLEKIIQTGFDLPEPGQYRLNAMMRKYLYGITLDIPSAKSPEFDNFFNSIVAPELRTPRDVIRLTNTLSIVVTSSIKDEIFFPDLMGLETLRIFRPRVYRAIRANKSEILGLILAAPYEDRTELEKKFFHRLLGSEAENERERLRVILTRLFPQLQSIFVNTSYSEAWRWKSQRRVCSREHFDSYFRFALSPEAIPRGELDYLLNGERTVEEIQQRFIEAIKITQAEDRSKASYLLDELTAHGRNVPISQAKLILSALFPIADKIMDIDKEGGFGIMGNRIRLHWLLRTFLLDRTTINQRSEVLVRSMKGAPLQWLSDFSRSAWEEHHPSKPDRKPVSEDEALLTREDAEVLAQKARNQIEAASIDGTLIDVADLCHILFEWDVLKTEGSKEVHRFTEDAIADDQKIVKLARAFLGKMHIANASTDGNSSGGNISSFTVDRAQIDGIERFLDIDKFRKRLISLESNSSLSKEDRDIIKRLVAAWEARDKKDSSIPKE